MCTSLAAFTSFLCEGKVSDSSLRVVVNKEIQMEILSVEGNGTSESGVSKGSEGIQVEY